MDSTLFKDLIERRTDELIYRMSLPDGQYEFLSSSCQKVTSYSAEEILSGSGRLSRIIHPEFRDYFEREWQDLVDGIVKPACEYKIIDKAGKDRWIHQNNVGIYDEKRKLIAIEGICYDVTQRVNLEEALRESEELSGAIIGCLKEGVLIHDRDFVFQYWSPTMEHMTGLKEGDVIGKCALDLFPFLEEYGINKSVEKVFQGETIHDGECRFSVPSTGKEGWYSGNYAPRRDGKGEIIGVVATIYDISGLKELNNRLELSRHIIDRSLMSFFLINNKDQFVYVNDMSCRKLGYTREELMSMKISDIDPGYPRSLVADTWEMLRQRKRLDIEAVHKRKDGTLFPVRICYQYLNYKGREYGFAYVEDTTEQKRTEEKIRHLNRVLYATRNIAQLIVREKDQNRFLSKTCELLVQSGGYFNAWIMLVDESLFFNSLYDSESGKIRNLFIERFRSGNYCQCAEQSLGSQEVVCTDASNEACRECPLSGQRECRNSMTVRLQHNERIYGVISTSVPGQFLENTEEHDLFREVADDIAFALHNIELENERNRIIHDLRKSQERLSLAKTEAESANQTKSEFLANMGHEIRTPLSAIIGFSEVLLDSGINEEQQRDVSLVLQNAENLLSIIDDILDFSRIEAGKISFNLMQISLEDTVDSIICSWSPKVDSKRVRLYRQFAADVPESVLCDRLRLEQVLNNLVGNAVKFTDSGEIAITVEVLPDHLKASADSGEEKSGSGTVYQKDLLFIVRDTGIGIPADELGKIFDRFQQVESGPNRRFNGSGLGLAIVKRILEDMGGEIWVDSKIGKGTVFYFTLRASSQLKKPERTPAKRITI